MSVCSGSEPGHDGKPVGNKEGKCGVSKSRQNAFLQQRLAAVLQANTAAQSTLTLFVVLRDWHEPTYVKALMEFLKTLDALPRQKWLANFTKVRILAGDPRRGAIQSLLQYVADDVGFALVDSTIRHDPLSRLLVDFQSAMLLSEGERGVIDMAHDGADIWHIHLDVSALSLQTYLVHLTHLLAESFILLKQRMPATVRMTHVSVAPTLAEAAYARIDVNDGVLQCRGTLMLERP
ncbi:MAG: DUF6182 family protein [Moraxellaceae bacterium]|nr:DUF6182 family protein [Moraxellaceae bacterium]